MEELLLLPSLAARFNVEAHSRALASRGPAWSSPAVSLPACAPEAEAFSLLLAFDPQPLPCALLRGASAEGETQARLALRAFDPRC